MELTLEAIRSIIDLVNRRCDAARMAGGIALDDAEDGVIVPEGWVLDPFTMYYLPPEFRDISNVSH